MYRFGHDKNSLVRFLDSAKLIEKGTAGSTEDVTRQIQGVSFSFSVFLDDLVCSLPCPLTSFVSQIDKHI